VLMCHFNTILRIICQVTISKIIWNQYYHNSLQLFDYFSCIVSNISMSTEIKSEDNSAVNNSEEYDESYSSDEFDESFDSENDESSHSEKGQEITIAENDACESKRDDSTDYSSSDNYSLDTLASGIVSGQGKSNNDSSSVTSSCGCRSSEPQVMNNRSQSDIKPIFMGRKEEADFYEILKETVDRDGKMPLPSLESLRNKTLSEKEMAIYCLEDNGGFYSFVPITQEVKKGPNQKGGRKATDKCKRIEELSKPRSRHDVLSEESSKESREILSRADVIKFCNRMERKENLRKSKLQKKIKEKELMSNENKLKCSNCGLAQSLNEKLNNLRKCSNPDCIGGIYKPVSTFNLKHFENRMRSSQMRKARQIESFKIERDRKFKEGLVNYKYCITKAKYDSKVKQKGNTFFERMDDDLIRRATNKSGHAQMKRNKDKRDIHRQSRSHSYPKKFNERTTRTLQRRKNMMIESEEEKCDIPSNFRHRDVTSNIETYAQLSREEEKCCYS